MLKNESLKCSSYNLVRIYLPQVIIFTNPQVRYASSQRGKIASIHWGIKVEIGRTLSQYGDISYAVVVLGAVVRVWKEHRLAICAWGALHWGALLDVGGKDVGAIAEAWGQDNEEEGGEVSGHCELMLAMMISTLLYNSYKCWVWRHDNVYCIFVCQALRPSLYYIISHQCSTQAHGVSYFGLYRVWHKFNS